MKCFVSCVTYEPEQRARELGLASSARACARHAPKLRPTMQCQVGPYFLSNSFLMKAAMSFSMLYFSSAFENGRKAGQTAGQRRQLAAPKCAARAGWA